MHFASAGLAKQASKPLSAKAAKMASSPFILIVLRTSFAALTPKRFHQNRIVAS
jgi:hypothetical protein